MKRILQKGSPGVTGVPLDSTDVAMGSREQLVHLLEAPEGIAEIVPTDVPRLLGELETLRVQLIVRLLGGNTGASVDRDNQEVADRLLTVDDAAAVLCVTPRWLYRRSKRLPFAQRLSGKVLRFSEIGLQKWLEHRRGRA